MPARNRAQSHFFLAELSDGREASFRDELVQLRRGRPVKERAEIDGRSEHDVNRVSMSRHPCHDLLDEVVAQSTHEHRDNRNSRLADDAADSALRGEECVRVVVLLARPLGVHANEKASASQQISELVQALHIERGPTPIAEDRRIHGKKAHRGVDQEA